MRRRDTGLRDRLRTLQDLYHKYHGSGDSIIWDERLTPETRVERFVEHARSNPNLGFNTDEEAAEFCITQMEQMGDAIAGRWGKVDDYRIRRIQEGQEEVSKEGDETQGRVEEEREEAAERPRSAREELEERARRRRTA